MIYEEILKKIDATLLLVTEEIAELRALRTELVAERDAEIKMRGRSINDNSSSFNELKESVDALFEADADSCMSVEDIRESICCELGSEFSVVYLSKFLKNFFSNERKLVDRKVFYGLKLK